MVRNMSATENRRISAAHSITSTPDGLDAPEAPESERSDDEARENEAPPNNVDDVVSPLDSKRRLEELANFYGGITSK